MRLPVTAGTASRRLRGREIRFGLRHADAIFRRIDLDEQRLGSHVIVITHGDRLHIAAHLGQDGNQMAVDRRVVRRLVAPAVAPLPERPERPEGGKYDEHREDDSAASAFFFLCRRHCGYVALFGFLFENCCHDRRPSVDVIRLAKLRDRSLGSRERDPGGVIGC